MVHSVSCFLAELIMNWVTVGLGVSANIDHSFH